MRRLTCYPVQGNTAGVEVRNLLSGKFRSKIRSWVFVFCSSLHIPFLKPFIYRCWGVRTGKGTEIGLGAKLDVFFPGLISLGENTIIGPGVTIAAHEFAKGEMRIGKVEIGDNVIIGANATILPGVKIGANAVIQPCSLVNRDIPPNAIVEGIPVKIVGTMEQPLGYKMRRPG